MDIMQLIKPELMILVPVLYVLGKGIKKSNLANHFIPLILGVTGIVLAFLYQISIEKFGADVLFASITQGILSAGLSVYTHQLFKQFQNTNAKKAEKPNIINLNT